MDTAWLDEQLPMSQKKVIGDILFKGKESATQLQTLLQKHFENHGSVSAKELAAEIVRSFADTLSILSSPGDKEICQIETTKGMVRASSSKRSSKTPERSRKRPAAKDRRGCYTRRNASEAVMNISSTAEDDYAWRKYGQKEILNSKFPRCYFRCSHKHDLGCKATKQVQMIKQDPLTYQTTYFGHHTCNDPMRAPQIIPKESDPTESCLLNFETKVPPPSKQDSVCSAIIPAATKEVVIEDTHSNISDDKSLWQDLMTSESSAPAKVMPSKSANSYHGEVVSSSLSSDCACTSTPSQDLAMEAFDKFGELDNGFYLDESEFFHIQGFH